MYTVKEKIQHTLTNAMVIVKAESDISILQNQDKIDLITLALTNKQKSLLIIWFHIINGEYTIDLTCVDMNQLQNQINDSTLLSTVLLLQYEYMVRYAIDLFLKGEFENDQALEIVKESSFGL
jgi:hypothetical protein